MRYCQSKLNITWQSQRLTRPQQARVEVAEFAVAVVLLVVVAGIPQVAVRIAVVSVESEQLRAPAAVEVAVAVAEPLMVAVFAVEPWT